MAVAVGSGVPRGRDDAGVEGTWSWGELQGGDVQGPAPVCVGTALDAQGGLFVLCGHCGLKSTIQSCAPPADTGS